MTQGATVDREFDAGHVLRLVRGEIDDAGGYIGRLSESGNHDVLLKRGALVRITQDPLQRLGTCVYEPDDDGVGPDVLFAEVDGQLAGHRIDRALGRVVGRPLRKSGL